MNKIKMSDKMEMVPLKGIRPYKRNPRNNTEAVPKVAESILKFGFRNPIILDKENVVIAGHTRLLAAKKLGLKEVPCIWANDLTPDEVKALRLVDNKTAEYAEWELELLNEELLDLQDSDIDMGTFGFGASESISIDDIEEDIPPEIPEEPKSKVGEIYQLGEHRLMVGDSTKEKDVRKLMDGVLADCCITDPPYNVAIGDKNKMMGNNNDENIANDKMSRESFKEFLNGAFGNLNESMGKGKSFYVFHSGWFSDVFIETLRENGMGIREMLIWVKNTITLTRQDYQWQHEPCIYGWTEGASHYFIDKRTERTVYEEELPDIETMTKDEMKKHLLNLYADLRTDVIHEDKPPRNAEHPTMKPVKLIARLMYNSTKKGETVLDLFGGSGTTMIAAEELGRKCYMMEYDPHYADVIIERWENKTGKKAVKVC